MIIGLPRWAVMLGPQEARFASEYNHYEGAVVHTLGLPMLVLADEAIGDRGIFSRAGGPYIIPVPSDTDLNWLTTPDFTAPFSHWVSDLSKRRDVFLGYCSSSRGSDLKRFLQMDLGATVLDWQLDFAPGRTILEEITEAASRCSGGVFLFTRDDELVGPMNQAAPRDNVVFEAGFFCHAKGKERVLIIREEGSEMPADLGGDIYATLLDRSNIGPIEQQVRMFVQQRL